MVERDLANTIYEERLEIGIAMVKRQADKNKMTLSSWEILDIATRIASSLFIEKNKDFRSKQIRRD